MLLVPQINLKNLNEILEYSSIILRHTLKSENAPRQEIPCIGLLWFLFPELSHKPRTNVREQSLPHQYTAGPLHCRLTHTKCENNANSLLSGSLPYKTRSPLIKTKTHYRQLTSNWFPWLDVISFSFQKKALHIAPLNQTHLPQALR